MTDDITPEAALQHLDISHNHEAGLIPASTRHLIRALAARLAEVTAERDKAQKFGQDMVARAASGGVLDGYRELGARAAAAEMDRRVAAEARVAQLEAALSKASEIISDLMEQMDWVGTGSSEIGDLERAKFEARILSALDPPTTEETRAQKQADEHRARGGFTGGV
jgi:hypothetical protein